MCALLTPFPTHEIANCFLPRDAKPWARFDYHYTKGKLRSDPLYPHVAAQLKDSKLPLLDVGCGLGLLAHVLRACGHRGPYAGVDHDGSKIARAKAAAAKLGQASFATLDVQEPLPVHAGDVALLDVLHYLPAEAQAELLRQCASRVAPGGQLVLRVGLRDGSWRYRATKASDTIGRMTRWMKCGALAYPTRDEIEVALAPLGLRGEFTPLYQGTPFNNYLAVFTRPLH